MCISVQDSQESNLCVFLCVCVCVCVCVCFIAVCYNWPQVAQFYLGYKVDKVPSFLSSHLTFTLLICNKNSSGFSFELFSTPPLPPTRTNTTTKERLNH
jgi:hypothetical protein